MATIAIEEVPVGKLLVISLLSKNESRLIKSPFCPPLITSEPLGMEVIPFNGTLVQ
jgi:hypothetical protein